MSTIECPLCGATKYGIRFRIGEKMVISCMNCNLIRYHPITKNIKLSEMYENDTYFETNYFKVDDERLNTTHYKHFIKVANLAKKCCSNNEKLLEIGPGQGLFLKMCLNRGLKVEGLEYSNLVAKKLHTFLDCPIYHMDLTKNSFGPETYSMVVAFDVIEHCVNPTQWLHSIHRILKQDGFLVISTISVKNLLDNLGRLFYKFGIKEPVVKLYPPYHLYYFTPDTLRLLLEKTGFSVEEIVQENYDYRKATSNKLEQLIVKYIYFWHCLTGNKTNQYVTARKV